MEPINFDKFREMIEVLSKSPELAEKELNNISKVDSNSYTQMIQGACIYWMSKNTPYKNITINELLEQLKDVKTLDDFAIWIQNTKHLTNQQLTHLRYKLYKLDNIDDDVINWTMGFTWALNIIKIKENDS